MKTEKVMKTGTVLYFCDFGLLEISNKTRYKNEFIYKTEIRLTNFKNKLMVIKGKGEDKLGAWD